METNHNEEEKRCFKCKKLLIDEKIPLCLRCRIDAKNVTVGAATVTSIAVPIIKKIKK